MPLESCMILLDCSEYMRNGDYIPTRLQAQQDAANMLVGAKTNSHPESTVGVSAGTELLVSPTEDVGKILQALHGLSYKSTSGGSTAEGTGSITAAVQVASLALKHRRNKNGSQRIILFVGTPLTAVENKALTKAGRQLKKNNVSIDVVALGELDVNEPKLKVLVDAANGRSGGGDDTAGERTCHLVTVPAGVLPSDVLASSPILAADGGAYAAAAGVAAAGAAAAAGAGAAAGGAGGGADANPFGEFGGVDPNMDPELAMALRVSMEEERARQERAAAAAAAAAASSTEESKDQEMPDAGAGDGAAGAAAPTPEAAGMMHLSEEDALLQQALQMSMQENEPPAAAAAAADDTAAAPQEDSKPVAMDEDEDAAMQMALQMSMQQEEETASGDAAAASGQQQQFQDPSFVNELLGSMPGVDPNDPEIQQALKAAAAKKEEEEKDDKKDDDDDDKKE